jgi:hypothetical protein
LPLQTHWPQLWVQWKQNLQNIFHQRWSEREPGVNSTQFN